MVVYVLRGLPHAAGMTSKFAHLGVDERLLRLESCELLFGSHGLDLGSRGGSEGGL